MLGFSTRLTPLLVASQVPRLVGVAVGVELVIVREVEEVLLETTVEDAVGEGVDKVLEDVT